MNLNKAIYDLEEKIKKCHMLNEYYLTTVVNSTTINNYCLIAKLTRPNDSFSTVALDFEVEASAWGFIEKANFSAIMYTEGTGTNKFVIYGYGNQNYFDVVGDVVNEELKLYIKSKRNGLRFRIKPLANQLGGYVSMYSFNKFDFLESQFTRKINTIYEISTFKNEVKIETNKNRGFKILREISGVIHTMWGLINDNGNFRVGKHTTGDIADSFKTAVEFGDEDITVIVPSGKSLQPFTSARYNLGNSSNKWKSIYLNDGVVNARDYAPTDPVFGMSFFYTVTKQWVTYFDGKWWSDGVVVNVKPAP